jgi:hypothetical protein
MTNQTQNRLERKLEDANSFFGKVYRCTAKLGAPSGAYEFSNSYKHRERKIKTLLEKVKKYGINLSEATYKSGKEYIESDAGCGMSSYSYQSSPDTYKLETKKGSVYAKIGESEPVGLCSKWDGFRKLYSLPSEISLSFHYTKDSDKKEILRNLMKKEPSKRKK